MNITVNGQLLTVTDDALVSNSVDIYECEFTFDSSWDGFSKTSVWKLNSDDPIEVVISNGKATIPHEVLVNAGFLRIGVYGTKDEKVMPTVWLETRKVCLGTPTGSIGTDPTPSIYAQILAVATNAENVANGVKTEWESVSATAETLPEGSSATASFDDGVFTFGIPRGAQGERGDRGETGAQGEDGFSPIVTVTSIVGGHQITITDSEGAHIFAVMDGAEGEQGEDGVGIANITQNADYSLTITLTNGTTYTTTSLRGETGLTPDFSIGTVTTLNPNESATASISGTAEEPILNLGIPRGQTGTSDFASYLPIDSASGTIASFTDGAEDIPVEELKVTLEPIQSGSGDPSPSNVRPISGHDEVVVRQTGKNLLVNASDTYDISQATYHTYNVNPTIPANSAVTLSVDCNLIATKRLMVYTTSGDLIKVGNNGSKTITFTPTSDLTAFRMYIGNYDETVTHIIKAQLELGSTATAYEPYNGTTYPISLGQTVYGGVLDVVSGVLTVENAILPNELLCSNSVSYEKSANGAFVLSATNATLPTNTNTNYVDPNLIASALPTVSQTAIVGGSAGVAHFWGNRIGIGTGDSSISTGALLRTWLRDNGSDIVYPLATPQTITLTPQEIATFKSANNIWSDNGTISVTYRADIQGYIDKKISALATL